MSMVRALDGRRPSPELELHGWSSWSSPERGERGKERGEEQGARLAELEVEVTIVSSCITEGSRPFTPG
jgi:hypothetical protein